MTLQPLAVDWREKLKANRKGSKKRPLSSASPDPLSQTIESADADPSGAADIGMTADGKPNLELLSKGLPAGWRAMWDKNTGDIYYGNLKSRVRFCLLTWAEISGRCTLAAFPAKLRIGLPCCWPGHLNVFYSKLFDLHEQLARLCCLLVWSELRHNPANSLTIIRPDEELLGGRLQCLMTSPCDGGWLSG